MDSIAAATYAPGTAVLTQLSAALAAPSRAQHGIADAALLGSACPSMTADACTGTAVLGGGMFGVTGLPVFIAEAKPNARTGAPPRDRLPV